MASWDELLSTPPKKRAAAPQESGGFLDKLLGAAGGVGGWEVAENAVGELKDIGLGLGTLGITLAKDVGGEALSLGTGGLYNHSSTLDDLLKAAPKAIAQDYKERYGSWEGFRKGLYEEPLAFVGDALTVATAGGYAAARGASTVGRTARAADELSDVARGAKTLDDVARTTRVVDKILPGAKDRALLESMGHKSLAPLGGTRRTLDPATGLRVQDEISAFNPARRLYNDVLWEKAKKMPVSRIEKTIKELKSLDRRSPDQDADLAMLEHTRDLARNEGINRVWQPTGIASLAPGPRKALSTIKGKQIGSRLIGDSTFHHVRDRDRFTAQFNEKIANLSPEEADKFHVVMQFDTPASKGRLAYDDIKRLDETIAVSPKGKDFYEIKESLLPRVDELTDPTSEAYEKIGQRVTLDFLKERKRDGRQFTPGKAHLEQLTPEEAGALTARVSEETARVQSKARRYVEGQSEGFLSEDVPTTPMDDAFDDVNYLRQKELTEAWVKHRGAEALADAFDNAYMPLQLALERRIAGNLPRKGAPYEGIVDDVYEALGKPDELPSTEAIDDAMQQLGRKQPGYFPKMLPTDNKSDFLMRIGGSPAGKGIRKKSQPARYKKSEGVLLGDFLDNQRNFYETNPAEAYTRAASQIIRHKETERFIEEFVTTLGRPLDGWEQKGSAERVINLDAAKMKLRTRAQMFKQGDDYVQNGADLDEASIQAIRSSLDNVVDEKLRPMTAEQGRLYAVPQFAAKQLEALGNQSVGGKGVRLFFDGPINFWRDSVLYFAPRYHVNNTLGNTAFLKLQGGKFGSVVRQMDKRYRKEVTEAIPEELRAGVLQGLFSDVAQRKRHLGDAADTQIGRAVTRAAESSPAKVAKRVRDESQAFGSAIENAFRRESYLTGMEKAASKRGIKLAGKSFFRGKKRLEQIAELGADPIIAREAFEDMVKTMNDFSRLSSWERNYVKRFIAPFWSFYRHSARMLVTMPFEHPAKARVLDWVTETSRDMDKLGPVPDFLESHLHVGPGEDPGEQRFASTRGANPFQVFENPLSMLNPMLQSGLEQVTGRDTFTGKQFTAPGVFNDPISGEQYRINEATGQAEPLEDRLGGLLAPVAPGPLESLLQMSPQVELFRDLKSGGARYSAEDEVMIDPATGKPRYETDRTQELLKLLGVSTIDYNLPEWQRKDAEARQRATTTLLNRGD